MMLEAGENASAREAEKEKSPSPTNNILCRLLKGTFVGATERVDEGVSTLQLSFFSSSGSAFFLPTMTYLGASFPTETVEEDVQLTFFSSAFFVPTMTYLGVFFRMETVEEDGSSFFSSWSAFFIETFLGASLRTETVEEDVSSFFNSRSTFFTETFLGATETVDSSLQLTFFSSSSCSTSRSAFFVLRIRTCLGASFSTETIEEDASTLFSSSRSAFLTGTFLGASFRTETVDEGTFFSSSRSDFLTGTFLGASFRTETVEEEDAGTFLVASVRSKTVEEEGEDLGTFLETSVRSKTGGEGISILKVALLIPSGSGMDSTTSG